MPGNKNARDPRPPPASDLTARRPLSQLVVSVVGPDRGGLVSSVTRPSPCRSASSRAHLSIRPVFSMAMLVEAGADQHAALRAPCRARSRPLGQRARGRGVRGSAGLRRGFGRSCADGAASSRASRNLWPTKGCRCPSSRRRPRARPTAARSCSVCRASCSPRTV